MNHDMLKNQVKKALVNKILAEQTFSDLVNIVQGFTAEEKAFFTKSVIEGKDDGCHMINERLRANIEISSDSLAEALVTNPNTTMAELKAAMGIV